MFYNILLVLLLSICTYASEKTNNIKVCFLEWGKQGDENLSHQGFNPYLVTNVLKNAGYSSPVDIMTWKLSLLHVKKSLTIILHLYYVKHLNTLKENNNAFNI